MTKTLNQIRNALVANGDGFALDMLKAIELKAETNSLYAERLAVWLRDGSTIVLRDELCQPFKTGSIVEHYRASLPMPFVNMWDAIDSAFCSPSKGEAK